MDGQPRYAEWHGAFKAYSQHRKPSALAHVVDSPSSIHRNPPSPSPPGTECRPPITFQNPAIRPEYRRLPRRSGVTDMCRLTSFGERGTNSCDRGCVPKWFKGTDCKSVIRRFESGRSLFGPNASSSDLHAAVFGDARHLRGLLRTWVFPGHGVDMRKIPVDTCPCRCPRRPCRILRRPGHSPLSNCSAVFARDSER